MMMQMHVSNGYRNQLQFRQGVGTMDQETRNQLVALTNRLGDEFNNIKTDPLNLNMTLTYIGILSQTVDTLIRVVVEQADRERDEK